MLLRAIDTDGRVLDEVTIYRKGIPAKEKGSSPLLPIGAGARPPRGARHECR